MEDKGQASVVGGLFAIVMVILLFLSMTYAQLKYIEIMREAYQKVRLKDVINESLELEVNYTIHTRMLASSVTTYEVIIGTLVGGNVYSLNYANDDDHMIIESKGSGGGILEENLIKNSEFDEDFNYWDPKVESPGVGEWNVVTVGGDNVAEFYAYTKPPTATAKGSLSQEVEVGSNVQEAILSFDFWMYASRKPSLFKLLVFIDNKVIFEYEWDHSGSSGWIHEEIDVTSDLEPGTRTIKFFIQCTRRKRSTVFKVRLDSITLNVKRMVAPYLGNVIVVKYNIDLPPLTSSAYLELLIMTNAAARIDIYVFDYEKEVFELVKGVFTDGDDWFWIDINVTELQRLEDVLKFMIYLISNNPIELRIDYLSINLYIFNPGGAYVKIKNLSSSATYIISLWLINATHHTRFSVEEYLDVNMTLIVPISNSTFLLSKGCEYKVRVWSKVRSYEILFETPKV